MLDYKSIIIKRYALHMIFKELADEFNASKSGINDFIHAFEKCENLSYPLPEGITNYAIYKLVYGHEPGSNNRSSDYEQQATRFCKGSLADGGAKKHDACLPLGAIPKGLQCQGDKTLSHSGVFTNGFVDKDKLMESAKAYGKSPYGEHLKAVAEGRVRY